MDDNKAMSIGLALAEMTAERDRLREINAEWESLVSDLLDIWAPQWNPGVSLRKRALDLLAKARNQS